ncbi:hypothetical protein MKZ20_22080 [Psychrobacillus sp. FSL K6-2684]|uniref:hypothetical protein n=1 Tax=unclassified Psychrobacillus TaxID=2636677 RepID=UPI0030FA5F4A
MLKQSLGEYELKIVKGNIAIVCEIGTGKNATVKNYITQLVNEGQKVVVYDYEKEFGGLTKALNGKVISLSDQTSSGEYEQLNCIQYLQNDSLQVQHMERLINDSIVNCLVINDFQYIYDNHPYEMGVAIKNAAGKNIKILAVIKKTSTVDFQNLISYFPTVIFQ